MAYILSTTQDIREPKSKEFRVLNTTPERVVLWMTDEIIICSPFDRNDHTVEPSFVVIKIGEDPTLEYTSERIGPLEVKPLPNSTVSLPTPTPTEQPQPTFSQFPTTTLTPTREIITSTPTP